MPALTAVIGEGISSGAPFKKIFPVVFPSPARLRATLSLPDWAPPMNAVTCPARSERLTPEARRSPRGAGPPSRPPAARGNRCFPT